MSAITSHEPTIDSQWKQNLVIDFDGVVHSYERGWQGGYIYGEIVPGFFEWAMKAKQYFNLVIYSSRSSSHKTRQPMEDWFKVHLQSWKWDNPDADLKFEDFQFAMHKVPTFVSIDDRAITFKGDWSDPRLNPQELLRFKPWNVR